MTVDKAALRALADTLNGILLPEGYNRQALKDAAVALPALLAENDALRAELQARQWMPIETAPKHTEVLVWRDDSGSFIAKLTSPDAAMDEAELEAAGPFPDDFEEWFSDAYGWQEGNERPTHWMPLPPAPPQGDGA